MLSKATVTRSDPIKSYFLSVKRILWTRQAERLQKQQLRGIGFFWKRFIVWSSRTMWLFHVRTRGEVCCEMLEKKTSLEQCGRRWCLISSTFLGEYRRRHSAALMYLPQFHLQQGSFSGTRWYCINLGGIQINIFLRCKNAMQRVWCFSISSQRIWQLYHSSLQNKLGSW